MPPLRPRAILFLRHEGWLVSYFVSVVAKRWVESGRNQGIASLGISLKPGLMLCIPVNSGVMMVAILTRGEGYLTPTETSTDWHDCETCVKQVESLVFKTSNLSGKNDSTKEEWFL